MAIAACFFDKPIFILVDLLLRNSTWTDKTTKRLSAISHFYTTV